MDGHGGSGGRRSQARCRGGSRGKQFSSATGGERRQSLHVLGVYLGLLHLGERLPSLTCGRGGERGKKGGSPEDGSARARKGAQGRYRVISKCGSYRVRLRVGQYPRRSVFDIIRNNIIFCVNTYYIIVFFEGFINSQYTLNMCSELTVGGTRGN